MLSYPEMAAEVMVHFAGHDSHGYTQGSGRWGNGATETVTLSDGTAVDIALGDRDCSAGVISAWEAVLPGATAWATYTGDMRSAFLSTGLFGWVPASEDFSANVGDVCLAEERHTAMIVGVDQIAEFSIAEDGTIYGKQEGDQTGYECAVNPYRGGWDGFIVYIGPKRNVDETMVYAQSKLQLPCERFNLTPPPATGEYDEATQRTIARLIEQVILSVGDPTLMADGVVDAQTVAALNVRPVEALGDGSQAMLAVKVALVGNGYRGATVDGEWRGVSVETWDSDAAATEACKRFQVDHGLEATGTFDGETVRALVPMVCAE